MACCQVVSSMTSLETLDLENNNLGAAHRVAGAMDEEGEPLGEAHDGMGQELQALTRMQCLNLTKNRLLKVPDVVAQFVALRILDLTDNGFVFRLDLVTGGQGLQIVIVFS